MYGIWCWWVLNTEVWKFTHTTVLAKRYSKLWDLGTHVQRTGYSEIVARNGMTKYSCKIQTENWNKEFRNSTRSGVLLGSMRPGCGFWPLALLKLRMSKAIPLLFSSYRTSCTEKNWFDDNVKMQIQKTVCVRNVPQLYRGRLFWAAVNLDFLTSEAFIDSFSGMVVFVAVAKIDNSAAFPINYESQIWEQMQAPGAITSVTTNSTIPDVSDNFLIRDNDLLWNRPYRQILVQN